MRRIQLVLGSGAALLALLVAMWMPGSAWAEGVAQVLTSKSIPEATVAVIDPEGGGGGSSSNTDVNVSPGDIILFRFNFFAVPDQILRGLQGYLTEYIPGNTRVVGVRLMDADGKTIKPRYPGLAVNGCGAACNGFNAVNTANGATNLDDGTISQVYADTGMFYTLPSETRTARIPDDAFITLTNGQVMNPAPKSVGAVSGLIGAGATVYVHNLWDWHQVLGFGVNASETKGTGNTPFGWGSPVAGPDTFYPFEATQVAGVIQYNDDSDAMNDGTGPWNRIQYPGSLTGIGLSEDQLDAMNLPEHNLLMRSVTDAAGVGFDLKPSNPLPQGVEAVRMAMGEIWVGQPGFAEVALLVLDTPLDPIQDADVDCAEVFGGDASAKSQNSGADDNAWPIHIASPNCVFLNLKFDAKVTHGPPGDNEVRADLATNGDILTYTVSGKNLSIYEQTNVMVRLKYDSGAVQMGSIDNGGVEAGAGTANCNDGDGYSCIVWQLGTLAPGAEYELHADIDVNGGPGAVTKVVPADYSSDQLPLPGFSTQALTVTKEVGIFESDVQITATDPNTYVTTIEATLANTGTGLLDLNDFDLVLPSGFTAGMATVVEPDLSSSNCALPCGLGYKDLAPGETITITVTLDPGASPDGLYEIGIQQWGFVSGYGGNFESFIPDAITLPIGADRSAPPVLTCPIGSNATDVSGTTAVDNSQIRLFFNLIERGTTTSTGTDWTVGTFGDGTDFGVLYGGLEVRATAQAPNELESELSEPCFVELVPRCSDGIDNDMDGLTDYPVDPGCASATDTTEDDVACSDGIDNDMDGDVDWPDDLECDGPDDGDEGGMPACGDGIDNDGDGNIDFPADLGCTSSMDRSEIQFGVCNDGIDNDGDMLADYPEDPGCHSINDDDEVDITEGDIRSRLLVIFDTSGSMNWNTCDSTFTGGDGSLTCGGSDVTCLECNAENCGDGLPNDSRLYKAKQGVADVVAGFGDIEYGLMRFTQRPLGFSCPTANSSNSSGGWQGSGSAPCGAGTSSDFATGELLVDFSPDNPFELIEYLDGETNYNGTPPPGLDIELRGSGTTPLDGALSSALAELTSPRVTDPAAGCRPYQIILLTDGQETCGGDPVPAAEALYDADYPVNVIGFATSEQAIVDDLNAIARAGSGDMKDAIFVDDSAALSGAMSQIVADSILTEICDGGDNDCDTFIDEGFTLFCDIPGGNAVQDLCTDPGETLCDGVDDNCNGLTDEGFTLYCDIPGGNPAQDLCVDPGETVCDGVDDNCNGIIDENNVCDGNPPAPETCNNVDDDNDMTTDEGLTRQCGFTLGECVAGTETCVAGAWVNCDAVGPTAEICDGFDNDCDGIVDGIVRTCGTNVGACVSGTELCTAGGWGSCTGAINPATETCDNIDNDCDTNVDEGDPGGGAGCGSSIGKCTPGTLSCSGGSLICQGGVLPTAEVCDGQDDDCDGVNDEGVPTGPPCGSDVGDCSPGVETCQGGSYVCVGQGTGGPESCDNRDNDCDMNIDENLQRSCGIDVGECTAGTQTCNTGGWDGCTGQGPVTEVCDGLDNDCDGATDEEVPTNGTCGGSIGDCSPGVLTCVNGAYDCVGEQTGGAEACDDRDNDCDGNTDENLMQPCGTDVGECTTGTATCVAGAWVNCTGDAPMTEACDNLDNDCDGVSDEEIPAVTPCGGTVGDCSPGVLTCVDGSEVCLGEQIGGPEECDDADNDCDGLTDEGLVQTCGTDVGECSIGSETCSAGAWISCDAVTPIAELCNSLDDDCDGVVDEAVPNNGACGGSVGDCTPGVLQCIDGGFVCLGAQNGGPEACDNRDNDCDGNTDEGLMQGCGTDVGECAVGTETCSAGSWVGCSAVAPIAEQCNTLDDDCDGLSDEEVPNNGACGGSVGDCTPGVLQCIDGGFVCLGAQNGGPEDCDGRDNDCDGSIDEGLLRACGTDVGQCSVGQESCDSGAWVNCDAVAPIGELCNAADDDCDGVTDEQVPNDGTCGTDVGDCSFGARICISGSYVCVGAQDGVEEECDNADNDCDGLTDEGLMQQCGTDVGECAFGMETCDAGDWMGCTAVVPDLELCDELDNDCDGNVDEGNPEGGGDCGVTDVGECAFGVEQCMSGALVCVGEVMGGDEKCDLLDNDCDGVVDEDDMQVGNACGTDTGVCAPGSLICQDGELVCDGGQDAIDEICNGLDDDCDGLIDDGIPAGEACGEDMGECARGRLLCVGGSFICSGAVGGQSEVCDSLDNDCDGVVDEGLGLGDACGDDEGVCKAGVQVCFEGNIICDGEVPPAQEVCDCEDNDCDGGSDEDPDGDLCPDGSACTDCQCASPCTMDEFVPCPQGRVPVERDGEECICVRQECQFEECAGSTIDADGQTQCAPGMEGLPSCECINNECSYPCAGVSCDNGRVCHPLRGVCVEDSCRGLGCPEDSFCDVDTGECAMDACMGVECGQNEVCREGECETSCAVVDCETGQRCERGGCVDDLCEGVSCEGGQICNPVDGACFMNPCEGVVCGNGEICDIADGDCMADPCTTVRCPSGQLCENGDCFRPTAPGGAGGGSGTKDDDKDELVLATGGGGCACNVALGAPEPERRQWPPGAWLGLLVGAALWLRRRRGGAK